MKKHLNISKKIKLGIALSTLAFSSFGQAANFKPNLATGADSWKLVWNDEFDYTNEALDKAWISQNAPSTHILCSRWRENANVSDGTLKLINKKEQKDGQEWTSGNIWTKEQFQYGYFECRYKYAGAKATNNSFWLMTQGIEPKEGKKFEIDINEGHYPNEIATNIHNWSDFYMDGEKKKHYSNSKIFSFGTKPDVSIQLEIPVKAKKVRFTSNHNPHFHLREFRIYGVNANGYPDVMSETADKDIPGLVNFAKEKATKLNVSGVLKDDFSVRKENLVDGNVKVNSWCSQPTGEKWVEFEFADFRTIGCIQFVNGWPNNGNYTGLISDYKIEYFDGDKWIEMSKFNINNGSYDFSKEFHTYGLDWSKEELIYYFDGKEIRREKNEFCYSPSPIWLSLAIISWSGTVTDAINGTQMEVDYVRVFKKK